MMMTIAPVLYRLLKVDVSNSYQQCFSLCDPVILTWPFDLGGRGIVTDYLCAKFGDFSIGRFGFIVRTDRQTESQRRINAILTRLPSVWVEWMGGLGEQCLATYSHAIGHFGKGQNSLRHNVHSWLLLLELSTTAWGLGLLTGHTVDGVCNLPAKPHVSDSWM